MGIFDKLFGSDKQADSAVKQTDTAVMEPPVDLVASCPHSVLLPRWDAVDDMGKEDRVTFYVCEACQQSFSPDEAQALKDTMAERLLEVTAEAPETPEATTQQ